MLVRVRTIIGSPSPARSNHLYSIFSPLRNQKRPKLSQTLTLEMVSKSTSKRPMCLSCSKPSSLCLCTRLKTSSLENSVAVTILQHSLEKKHPLNSTRIATLGLKNLNVVSVSDVNHEAQFVISLLESDCEMGSIKNLTTAEPEHGLDGEERIDANGKCALEANPKYLVRQPDVEMELAGGNKLSQLGYDPIGPVPRDIGKPALTFTITRYGATELNADQLLASLVALDALSRGFVVKKFQKKQLEMSVDYEQYEEFEIIVSPGSVLLFPSEESVGIEAIDFEVKNLIVLDGTWAKAKRMYSENPWLKLLPHLKLDLDKLSLYSEVRHQPKAGYLSTIESIVHALKALGDNPQGLDGLLDVFESMVGDQRRCKDERLSKVKRSINET